MKSYVEKNYSKKTLLKTDIQLVGQWVEVPFINIKAEYRDNFEIDEQDPTLVPIFFSELSEVAINDNDFEYGWYDYTDFMIFVNDLIKPANHYLVVAYGSNWRGQTGYKLVSDICDAFFRNDNCSQYVVGSSSRGKSLLITESNHDVPMGYDTLIIALTDNEWNYLNNADFYGDFDKIIDFADKKRESIIIIDYIDCEN